MREEKEDSGYSHMPNKRQALKIQKRENESEEFPNPSLATEAKLAA